MHPYSFWRNFRNYNFISQGRLTPQPQLLWGGGGEDGSAWGLVPSAVGTGIAGLAGVMPTGSAAPGMPVATSLGMPVATSLGMPMATSLLISAAPGVWQCRLRAGLSAWGHLRFRGRVGALL